LGLHGGNAVHQTVTFEVSFVKDLLKIRNFRVVVVEMLFIIDRQCKRRAADDYITSEHFQTLIHRFQILNKQSKLKRGN
jgi:hypothetical protein